MDNPEARISGFSRKYRIKSFFILLLFSICTSCSQVEEPAAETGALPNIVIILADDMGIGDIGAYNAASKAPTPKLDSLTASGMRFSDAHSPSGVCTPTRYGLLTGRYAWRTHIKKGVLKGYSPLLIDPARSTIASMLREKGYATAAIGKWHLGLGAGEVTDYSKPLNPGPNDVGFDYFFGIPASLDMPPYTFVEDDRLFTSFDGQAIGDSERRRYGGEGFWRGGPIARDFAHEDVLPQTAERSVAYIRERANSGDDRPFFLYVPLSAPHTPWMPTPEFMGRSDVGYYGDFVAQVDDTVGRIMEALDQTGATDNTLVIFASDNGARWFPEDVEQWGHSANMDFRGQKADIYEGGHRVPMIVSWPGKVTPGSQSTHLTSLTDLYATIADVAGIQPGPADGEDSETILPTLLGEQQAQRVSVVHHSARGMFAIRSGEWKLIEGLGSGGFTKPAVIEPVEGGPTGQLYNLAEDQSETSNLYLDRPDVVGQLSQMLNETRGADSKPITMAAAQASPNIIFIITDDQGWTSVSYPSDPGLSDSASDFFETPNMATLASEGMRFTQAYTPNPICAPARHAMLFGQRTTRHKYNQDETWIDRAPDWLTIPKAIKAANPDYRTAHFGKWHVGLKPELAGFDFSDGLTDNEEGDRSAGRVFADTNFIDQEMMDAYNTANEIDTVQANSAGRDRSVPFYLHDDPKTAFSLTARASAFIREAVADGKPFYAQISHYAVHSAFSARPESYAKFQDKKPGARHDDAAFGAMLFDLDEAIGQVMGLVKDLGIEDNTYIVVMADNGGVAYYAQTTQIDADLDILGTHRTRIPWNNAPLREGKHSFYEGGLRVPFIIAGPTITPNSHSDEPITGLDLLPTFARLAGYDGAFEGPLDGESLSPLIDGSEKTVFERKDPTLIFHQAGRRPPRSAVREGKYKLVKHWTGSSEVDGEKLPYTLELYDLDVDLGEKNDLSGVFPDIAADLHDKLLRHIAETNSEYEDNPRRGPMDIILEREGQGSSRKEQLQNRKPVMVDYLSPYKQAGSP